MGPLARRHAVAFLLSLLIAMSGVMPASALGFPGRLRDGRQPATTTARAGKTMPMAPSSGTLQEVAAPGGVQQLRQRLAGRHPRLSLQSPADHDLITAKDWTLSLAVDDWPLVKDPALGLGPHVVLQIDDQPPLRFSESSSGSQAPGGRATIKATLPALSPGSHRLTAYAAYPWGEAVKSPGASLQWRLDQLQPLTGTQPAEDAPWLVMVSPSELGGHDPLLLDWLIWNAPLQNLRDGDARWRLRLSVNGDSVLLDRQDALWLHLNKGGSLNRNQGGRVQMELLDGLGDPITPVFNNQLRAIPARAGSRPAWMKERMEEQDIARLLGEDATETTAVTPATAINTPATDSAAEAPSLSEAIPSASSAETGAEIPAARPVPATPQETEPTSEAEPDAPSTSANTRSESNGAVSTGAVTHDDGSDEDAADKDAVDDDIPSAKEAGRPAITPSPMEEPLRPTTSLGGSARELLNPDGSPR